MKALIIILSILTISCSPQKRINRIVKKHPELLVKDTIKVIDTIFIQSIHYDTTTKFIEHKTVEVINNDKVRLKYYFDTITKEINHYVECKGDTIIREIQVPYEKINVTTRKGFVWFDWLLVGVLISLLTFIFLKSK